MKAKEFRENEGFPKSSVTRNQKPYSTDDLMQAYSDHQNKELYDDLVEKRVECVKLEEEIKELKDLLKLALPYLPAGQLDSDICEALKQDK